MSQKIIYFVVGLLLIFQTAFNQIVELNSERIDSLPSYPDNEGFVDSLKKEYRKLINKNVDSILIYYDLNSPSNFAIVLWKKNNLSHCLAYYQYNPENHPVSKEYINNRILKNVGIKAIFNVFQDDEIRRQDTNILVSHDHPVYCQFYFGNRTELKAAYWSMLGQIDIDFARAYSYEEHRLFTRKKH